MIGNMALNKYKDDYETVVTTGEDGREHDEIVYRGDYYEIPLDEADLIRFKRNSLLLLAVIIVLHIAGGFLNNRGMYQMYVAIPYALAFFPLLYLTEGILRLPKEKRKYRRDEIGNSFERMKTSSWVLFVFLGIGVLGDIFFLLFIADGNRIDLDIFYLLIEVLVVAAVYAIIHSQRKINPTISETKEQL